MIKSDYNTAKSVGAFGQYIGAIIVSDSGFKAEYKKLGYRKVSRYNVQIQKKNYVNVVNSSTGAQKIGATFEPLRESYYNDEGLNGMFANLKKDNDKKYVKLTWDNDKNNTVETCYVDGDGNIIGQTLEDVKDYMTPSHVKSLTEGYGRTKVMKVAGIEVRHIQVKIENIAVLKIGGKIFTDVSLDVYRTYVKNIV